MYKFICVYLPLSAGYWDSTWGGLALMVPATGSPLLPDQYGHWTRLQTDFRPTHTYIFGIWQLRRICYFSVSVFIYLSVQGSTELNMHQHWWPVVLPDGTGSTPHPPPPPLTHSQTPVSAQHHHHHLARCHTSGPGVGSVHTSHARETDPSDEMSLGGLYCERGEH